MTNCPGCPFDCPFPCPSQPFVPDDAAETNRAALTFDDRDGAGLSVYGATVLDDNALDDRRVRARG